MKIKEEDHEEDCGVNRDISVTDFIFGTGVYYCTCGLKERQKGKSDES